MTNKRRLMMSVNIIRCIFYFLLSVSSYAQPVTIPTIEIIKQKTTRPAFLNISFGVQHSYFRDFATSPLIYTGNPNFIALSHIDFDTKRESNFRLAYSFGSFSSKNFQNETRSYVKSFSINYIELFEVQNISNTRFNFKWGGQINSTFNHRENSAFGNNSDGFEVVSTLFGSIKGTISINKLLVKQNSYLAFGLNLGLINSSYRNGFIYTRQAPLINKDNITDGYRFTLFSGFRMNSSLDYTIYLKNKNAIQFSYLWDAYKTGESQDNYEMAAHLFKLSILFKLK